MSEYLLEVKDLKQYFPIRTGWFSSKPLKAVDGVSFNIKPGETLGLVGESGCGKTTVGRTILHLYKPTSGEIIYNGTKITPQNIRDFRQEMQIVFQDPYSSLNPRMTVSDIVGEPLDIHGLYGSKQERAERITELLNLVGLNSDHARRYAHEFSGGQRQRIGIARALAVNPRFIVCDEPVSALDVSIQAQILNLLRDLQQQRGLTYLFISHDLNVVRYLSDRVMVMFLGQLCELSPTEALYAAPRHPYTRFLLEAVPQPDPTRREEARALLTGEVSSPVNPPSGCRFHLRCPYADERCSAEQPALSELEPGRFCACHHPLDG